MQHSEKIDQLAAALVKVQAQVSTVAKDSSNPFYKSKYASLDAVWEAVRKPLTDNGLAVSKCRDFLPLRATSQA